MSRSHQKAGSRRSSERHGMEAAANPGKQPSVFRRWLSRYLVFVGLAAHVAVPVAFYMLFKVSDKPVTQHFSTAIDAVKKRTYAGVIATRESRKDYSQVVMTDTVRSSHPRVLVPQLAGWTGGGEVSAFMQKRLAALRMAKVVIDNPCKSKGGFNMASCWIISGDDSAAEKAIQSTKPMKIAHPQAEGEYGNGWQFAVVYDLVYNYPGFSAADKRFYEQVIEKSLDATIKVLETDGPSLWHGRSTLAANAWIMATVLDETTPQRRILIRKAHGHFMSVIEAMEFSEAWPEGYNYWINVRAFQLILAMSAYINGTEDGAATQRIKNLMSRIGLWTIYATRPDNRIEGFGDEGPRVDLKDETQRVIDLIASATRKPVFAAYSKYLSHLHRKDSYYWWYRWGIPLFSDGDMLNTTLGNSYTSLEKVGQGLPLAEEFGRGSMGLAYIRSGWRPDDTFISFRAGHSLVHHGHYDAGSFTLFKNAPLAINSSTYGDFSSSNRLYYSIRSVAKNSMLIMRPGEDVRPNRKFVENVVDGGQRLVMPSGSTILNLEHWRKNLDDGAHYRGGEITASDFDNPDYAFLSSEIAPAYDTPEFDLQGDDGRVSRLNRQLLYLREEDRLIIHDKVNSVEPGFKKKWLLHTIHKPLVENEKVLKGDSSGGILETRDRSILVTNGDAELDVDVVYPRDAVTHLVGGPGYEFYVETDADDSTLDGKNFIEGSNPREWFDNGKWRIEVQPGAPRNIDHFLIALSPHLKGHAVGKVRPLSVDGRSYRALQTPDSVVIFIDKKASPTLKFKLQGRQTRVYVVGVPAGQTIHLDAIGLRTEAVASKAGVARLELFAPPLATVAIRW